MTYFSRCLTLTLGTTLLFNCASQALAQSPEDVIGGIVEDLLKGKSPIRRPTPPPRKSPPPTTGLIGSVRVVNESQLDATVEIHFSNGRRSRRTIRPGQTDTWQGLPGGANGSVTLGQNFRPFRVPGNGLVTLTVAYDGRIFTGKPPVSPPGVSPPGVNPPTQGRPPSTPPPLGNVGTNPLPPPRLPTSAPPNNLPRLSTETLPQEATKELSLASNRELRAMLESLKQAAATRVTTLAGELSAAGFSEEAATALVYIASSGDLAKLSPSLQGRIPNSLPPEVSSDIQTKLTAVTSFHQQFHALLSKFDAGDDYAAMAQHVGALRQQGTNLGVDELADTMTALQQHLMIRDAINQAAASMLGRGDPGIPDGLVNVIRHPRIHAGTTFIGGGQTVLVGINGGQIEVMRTTVFNAMGVPMATAQQPLSNWDEPKLVRGVIVHNPAENQVALSYRLNDQPHQLQAGTEQLLNSDGNLIIEFSRGPNRPNARYNISKEATYAFAVEEDGWNLRRMKFEVTMVNPPNSLEFNYLLDGEAFQVKRGESRSHNSHHPMVIQFDQGNGAKMVSKLVTEKLPLYIGLNPETNGWDLYRDPLDIGTEPPPTMTLALPKIQDFIQNPRSILFEFGSVEAVAAPPSDNLFEALRSAQ